MSNAKYFREKMSKAGFDIPNGIHPIVPVMLYDSTIAKKMADELLKKGVYVIGFYFPVVPKGKARIRAMIETRPDWCISRQRTWGVPITLLVHNETGNLHPNMEAIIENVATLIEQEGVQAVVQGGLRLCVF